MVRKILIFLTVVIVILAGSVLFLRIKNGPTATVVAEAPAASKVPSHAAPAPAASTPATVSSVAAATSPLVAAPIVLGTPRFGESLQYSANMAQLTNIATLHLKVLDQKEVAGKNLVHMQALASSENPFRWVFPLDDQFDSFSEAGSFIGHRYEMHLDEKGQKVLSVQELSSTGTSAAAGGATAARVVPGTRDPLGFLQYLRGVDWTKTPAVNSPVYDGRQLYEVKAHRTGSAGVTVPAGKFNASKIDVRVFTNGEEMKDAHFTLFLADNTARTPVLMEAILPIGTAQVQLMKMQ